MNDDFLESIVEKLRERSESEAVREEVDVEGFEKFADEQRAADEADVADFEVFAEEQRQLESVPEGFVDRGELPPVPASNFALSVAPDMPDASTPDAAPLNGVPTFTSTPTPRSTVSSSAMGGDVSQDGITSAIQDVLTPALEGMLHELRGHVDEKIQSLIADFDRRGASL